MSSAPREEVTRKAVTIQRAMIASQVIMAAAALAVVDKIAPLTLEAPEVRDILFPLLVILAVFDLGVAWLLPGILLRQERVRRIMLEADPNAPLERLTRTATEMGVHPLRAGLEAALAPYLIRLALIESVAVYGVVLSLLTVDSRYCIGFTVVALLATLAARFDPSPIVELHRRMQLEGAWRRGR